MIAPPTALPKARTGISGLDDVTGGGLPRGRPTLICGPAGCGKTLLAIEFIMRGILESDEPGVFVSFEESTDDLAANVASMGFDLRRMEAEGRLVLDHIAVAGTQAESGDWGLEGLLLRLGASIDAVGATRVVIDTIEVLFGAFDDENRLRAELRRLFARLKDRGVTSVITAERGDGTLTRHGIEEYVADCVIVLDHRVDEQNSTRRLRILKYRGSVHGTNEYPFLIGEAGVSVLPITALGLIHEVSSARVSTGVARLDAMLGGEGGYFKGSSVLVSGTAGTGKSTLAAQFCEAACAAGDRSLYFAFEESEAEIVRNMASVGIDLARWRDAGLLQFSCARPSHFGLEAHLVSMQRAVTDFSPSVVVMDPVSDLLRIGSEAEVSSMLTRQIDFLKARGITVLFTKLDAGTARNLDEQRVASLVDTWLSLKVMEGNGEHNRVLYVLKARGMAHSNQIREFLLTDEGIELADVYVGPLGVLTGSARQSQEASERAEAASRREDLEQRRVSLERRRDAVEAQTATLWRDFEEEADIVRRLLSHGSDAVDDRAGQRAEQGRMRRADEPGGAAGPPPLGGPGD